jgi:hypothetical protein
LNYIATTKALLKRVAVCADIVTDYLDNYANLKIIPFIQLLKPNLTIYGQSSSITERLPNDSQISNQALNLHQRLRRNQWTEHTFRSINWDGTRQALDTMEKSAQICIIKFAIGATTFPRAATCTGQAENDKYPACFAHC